MKTIKFYTLGCKVNQYDTQSIRERFIKNGFTEIQNGKAAGMYLINTCSVTHSADQKSRYMINRCIRENAAAKIVVTGCLVEKDYSGLYDIKGIDYIISKRFFPDGISSFCGHTRAFLKIQDGCSNFCSYCKVPLVRGNSRSRPLSEVIEEAKQLVRNGFKEIVLSGICLGSYGKDLQPKKNLIDVINKIEKIDGLWRLRLSSIEANQVSDKLIQKIAESKKLCRHLHIPMQSGDDAILEKMNRCYSGKDYIKLINKIKASIPEISITTDIMVGFPGEKEENFNNTVHLIKGILPFKSPYFSLQPKTRYIGRQFQRESFPGNYKKRMLRLTKLTEHCGSNFKKQFLNKELIVLIEAKSKENPGFWEGYTDNYIKVLVSSKKNLANQLIPVKPKEIYNDYMLTY